MTNRGGEDAEHEDRAGRSVGGADAGLSPRRCPSDLRGGLQAGRDPRPPADPGDVAGDRCDHADPDLHDRRDSWIQRLDHLVCVEVGRVSAMGQYVALLRGINVGGKNLIRMADLKACFEENGFENVMTYIQSGNVLFESGERSAAKLTQRIEEILSTTFNYQASVVLRSRSQLRSIVERAPDGFGTQPSRFLSDVIFLKPPLTAAAALKVVPTRDGVDRLWAGTGVLYS